MYESRPFGPSKHPALLDNSADCVIHHPSFHIDTSGGDQVGNEEIVRVCAWLVMHVCACVW